MNTAYSRIREILNFNLLALPLDSDGNVDENVTYFTTAKACAYVSKYCNLQNYPDYLQGQIISGPGALTDLTLLSSNSLSFETNSKSFTINLDLTNCDTANNTAKEIQDQLQLILPLATCVYVNSLEGVSGFSGYSTTNTIEDLYDKDVYIISNGEYGKNSYIRCINNDLELEPYLRFTPRYCAQEIYGSFPSKELDVITSNICARLINQINVYTKSKSIGAFSASYFDDMNPNGLAMEEKNLLNKFRRIGGYFKSGERLYV
jgi:hypothetical protein